jgi:hypothetical protein
MDENTIFINEKLKIQKINKRLASLNWTHALPCLNLTLEINKLEKNLELFRFGNLNSH